MGFLDMFDDPKIIDKLLGIGSAEAAAMPPTPPPSPNPAQGQAVPFTNAPSAAFASNANASMFSPGAPNTGPAPPQDASFPSQGAIGSDYAASGGNGPDIPWNAPGQQANVPLPPSRPPEPVPLPPSRPAMADSAAGPPQSLAPPSPAPAPPPKVGGLAAALGISPETVATLQKPAVQSMIDRGLAGLGKGLAAGAAGQPGGMAAFMRGAGGSLEGGIGQANKQFEQQRQLKNDLFQQSSIAFKDLLASKESGDKSALTRAHADYFAARAAEMKLVGGKGSSAWQNTPYGKVIQVENEAQKFEKGQQILLQKQWTLNGTTSDRQQTDLDALQKKVNEYRARLYKQVGIDPTQAEKLKNMGTAKDNPFDTKGMTLDQFHQQVPMGAWFKDQNGVVRQRTVPPPGADAGPSTAPPSRAADDEMALRASAG